MPDEKVKEGASKWILENVVKKNKDLREIRYQYIKNR